MIKLCECGCNSPAPIATRNDKKHGYIKGQPKRFIQSHNVWKGGRTTRGDGRLFIRNTGHPRANSRGYVRNATLIAEKVLGKYLPEGVMVHHADSNPSNDLNNNLIICENWKYHMLLHQRTRAYQTCGHASWRKCNYCKQYDKPENLFIYKQKQARHRECRTKYDKEKRKIASGVVGHATCRETIRVESGTR